MRIDPLLTNYPVRIRQVALGVFVGISSIFYVFPRALGEAEKTAYIIKDELSTILVKGQTNLVFVNKKKLDQH